MKFLDDTLFRFDTVPMIIHCPICTERHIETGEFEKHAHHTHACQSCGHVWRPAKINTHGVQFLPGYKNEPGAEFVCPLCNKSPCEGHPVRL